MIKAYKVYLDDGDAMLKLIVPAKNERDAIQFVEGNGAVIGKPVDITKDYSISLVKVAQALQNAHFGQSEMDIIVRMLESYEGAID